jgi:branched-chain amino acid aminotransferase
LVKPYGLFIVDVTSQNRSFLYGDGFFETMRIENGACSLLTHHLKRAMNTATFMEMTWPEHWTHDFFLHEIAAYTNNESYVLRLTFVREADGLYSPMGSSITVHHQYRTFVPSLNAHFFKSHFDEVGFYSIVKKLRPIRVAIYSELLKAISPLSNHKLCSAAFYVKAGIFLNKQDEMDDLLLLNTKNRPCEGLSSALLIFLDGAWVSPPLTEACVKSVYLSFVCEYLEIQFKPITLNDLDGAEHRLLVNAVQGVRSFTLIRSYIQNPD